MARSNRSNARQDKRNKTLLEGMGQMEPNSSSRKEKKSRWNSNQCQGLFDFKPTKWQNEFLEVIENHKISATDSVAG